MRQPATMEDFTLADLPDLSDWRFVPILSLEQAALLWGGIDPAFIPTFAIAKQRAHPLQYRRANIALCVINRNAMLFHWHIVQKYGAGRRNQPRPRRLEA